MPDLDLSTILADGEYLRRVGDSLDGGPGGSTSEDVVDTVAAALVAGSNIDVTYDDGAGTITVAVETLTGSDVGLGNVDNTTDAAKPVSTATQTALDTKPASTTVDTIGTGTQAAYDAIGTKDPAPCTSSP